jgi:DNA-binding response OmpR family regulator/two-component sensor histidine kinase
MKVLIAEDDPAFRHLLDETLIRWGYDTVVTKDGNEAWHVLQAEDSPPIAILDWRMPGMEGVDICRRVRKERQTPYTYIILLTFQDREEDIVTGMEAGANDYILKPLKIDELRVRLDAGNHFIQLRNDLYAARETIAELVVELECANRDLDWFNATVSDEILTPLMTISTQAQLLQEVLCRKDHEQCESYSGKIFDEATRFAQRTNTILNFYKPMRNRLHRETVDLSGMAKMITEKLQMTKPERRVAYRITEKITGYGDRNLLHIVLENLLSNAWKHTAKCEQAIIEFGVTEHDGGGAFFVRDNGTGFDVMHGDKLYKPLQRIPGNEEFAGHGVGLAMVQRIVLRHGGKVWADGGRDRGATFYFSLPAPRQEVEGKDHAQ